jgi:hypothetical protein
MPVYPGAHNTVRLHAGIGYVTPDDEHEGRGPRSAAPAAAGACAPAASASPTIVCSAINANRRRPADAV